jgi:hypothetical protein
MGVPSAVAHEGRKNPAAAPDVQDPSLRHEPLDGHGPAVAEKGDQPFEQGVEAAIVVAVVTGRIVAADLARRYGRRGRDEPAVFAPDEAELVVDLETRTARGVAARRAGSRGGIERGRFAGRSFFIRWMSRILLKIFGDEADQNMTGRQKRGT